MSHTIELPDPVYFALLQAAQSSGKSPVDWIAASLPPVKGAPITEEARRIANERLRACTVSLGHATGADNESIDADLAREFGADNAELYRPVTDR